MNSNDEKLLYRSLGEDSFGLDFADNVMAGISEIEELEQRERYSFGFMMSTFRPLILAASVLLAVLVPLSWYSMDRYFTGDAVDTITSIIDEINITSLEDLL